MNRAVARSGMMFAAEPPSRLMPWTRACCGTCWRQSPIPWNSRTTASSAFLPSHGSLAACAALPTNVTSTSSLARSMQLTMSRSAGWKRSAASSPSKSPSSSMNCLPLPRSSAGVPRKTTSPANESRTAARAIAAPTPDAAIVLWPQPCPRPPVSRPRTAVASRPAGCSTAYPWPAIAAATSAAARCSSKAGSGSAWIARESARISSRFASMAAVARAFRSDGAGMLTSTLGCDEGGSALDGERELGEDDEHDHEDCDGQAQDSLEAKGHEQPHHEPDPQAAACGAAPVAAIGDAAVAAECRQPEKRNGGQADREAHERRPNEPRGGIRTRVACQDEECHEHPRDGRRPEDPEVGQSRGRLDSR